MAVYWLCLASLFFYAYASVNFQGFGDGNHKMSKNEEFILNMLLALSLPYFVDGSLEGRLLPKETFTFGGSQDIDLTFFLSKKAATVQFEPQR